MLVSAEQLRRMAKGKPDAANMKSVLIALNAHGERYGLHLPHRLAHFFPQLLHESGSFKYDREIWGPTPAQKRYEGRADLGNTQKGDGKKFAGKGPIQLTGRRNHRAFTAWARKLDATAPNFETTPEAVNTDPWEGLSAIWYWDTGNPTGKSLNKSADENNIEWITRKINGGLNGYADRLAYYDRVALVLLDFPPAGIGAFQAHAKRKGWYDGAVDNESGPKTRAAMHRALVALTDKDARPDVQASPVVEVEVRTERVEITTEVERPVVPEKVEDQVKKKSGFLTWLTGILGSSTIGLGFLSGMDWQAVVAGGVILIIFVLVLILLRSQIIAAVREIKAEVAGE